MVERGCRVIVVPARSTAESIMAFDPHGIMLSNEPGDPLACSYAIGEIKKLLGHIPVFGICLGHQLVALALGASTYKLTFGHHGANHTVKNTITGKCYITSQNHGYAVENDSLKESGCLISFENLNDKTIEGLCHRDIPMMSVQFHPEASPGPQDTAYLFDDFLDMVKSRQRIVRVVQ